jgi:hypothetical protein
MLGLEDRLLMIERFCARDDLSTDDPYDIWKTGLGFAVKDLFNRRRGLGMLPAAALTLFDSYVNNRLRLGYQRQEYPIVRALAALALLNIAERSNESSLHAAALIHLEWLRDHSCPGYSGPCWGLGFRNAVSAGLVYDENMPLTTMTPYALEAFVRYTTLTNDLQFVPVIEGIHAFYDRDVRVMDETADYVVLSYAAMRDRRVINAQSYSLLCLGLLRPYLRPPDRENATTRMRKLYAYIVRNQREDGSWFYSPDGRPFVDCFHTCIVLKNLEKVRRLIDLPGIEVVIARGYAYLLQNFMVQETGLFKRFTVANKPGLIRYDLYDNAEMLNLAILLGDSTLVRTLAEAIEKHFVSGGEVFSKIDWFGFRRNRNMLRWAVMPYLYALSQL